MTQRSNARRLRRDMTDAERRLWRMLRNRRLEGWKFRRQHPAGPYILDFYCQAGQLAIEVDDGQHYKAEGRENDAVRTAYLESAGVRVLRFSNREVLLEGEAVVVAIVAALEPPSP